MKNTQTSLFTNIVLAATVAAVLTACGGGSNTETDTTPTPAPVATPTPPPGSTPSATPTPSPARVSKLPEIYYFDANGQWRLMPGVSSGQAYDAGVLCKIPPTQATIDGYLASGNSLEWILANIYRLDLCPGY